MEDYYTLLGVNRYASREELRRAYRSHILAVHPDHNPDDKLACARARATIEAYHVLSNPVTRRDYDMGIGYPATHLAVRTVCRNPISFQWVPRLMLILVFFGVLAGLAYGTMLALDSRNMVFRPSLETAMTAPDPESPTIFGRPIPKADTNVAREDQPNLASNIISYVCLRTALYAEGNASSGTRFFTAAAPALL